MHETYPSKTSMSHHWYLRSCQSGPGYVRFAVQLPPLQWPVLNATHRGQRHTQQPLLNGKFPDYSLFFGKGCCFGCIPVQCVSSQPGCHLVVKNTGILIQSLKISRSVGFHHPPTNPQNGAPGKQLHPLCVSCHQVHCSCELREFCAGLSALLRQ